MKLTFLYTIFNILATNPSIQCPPCLFKNNNPDWATYNNDLSNPGFAGTCPVDQTKLQTWSISFGAKCCCDGNLQNIFYSSLTNTPQHSSNNNFDKWVNQRICSENMCLILQYKYQQLQLLLKLRQLRQQIQRVRLSQKKLIHANTNYS